MHELMVDGRPFAWTRDGTIAGRPLFVCAHGAGAPLSSPFMEHVATGLAARGVSVVRFHFPYMEASVREGRKRGPDPAARLLATWDVILTKVRTLRGRGPLFIGGKSMGGRMASMLLAAGRAPDVAGAVYLGYPLHPPGQPAKLRAAHLAEVAIPQLFVSGDKDKLADYPRLTRVIADLPHATLLRVAGGDHSLATSRKNPFLGSETWLDAITAFVIARKETSSGATC